MLLDSVVRTSALVAASPGRLAKIDHIAGLLRDVPAAEIAVAVSFLSGDLTQRQIGVGYAALTDLTGGYGPSPAAAAAGLGGPAGSPGADAGRRLTTRSVRSALLAGQGSQAERRRLLAGLLGRATEAERQFLVRLLAGDLRQGALDGVMTDAIARAAGVPGADVRRAHQLSGSLPAAAAAALGAGGDPDAASRRAARCLAAGRTPDPADARGGRADRRRGAGADLARPRWSGRSTASGSRCTVTGARRPGLLQDPGRHHRTGSRR